MNAVIEREPRTFNEALLALRRVRREIQQLRLDYERLLKNFTVAQQENNRLHQRDAGVKA